MQLASKATMQDPISNAPRGAQRETHKGDVQDQVCDGPQSRDEARLDGD